jgi:cellulose biosynthesis protein BcsQ
MKVLSLICQKGGTSKTTTALNLAVEAAVDGLEVALFASTPRLAPATGRTSGATSRPWWPRRRFRILNVL